MLLQELPFKFIMGHLFVMNNGNIHDNGVIAKPKDNVHYGAGVLYMEKTVLF